MLGLVEFDVPGGGTLLVAAPSRQGGWCRRTRRYGARSGSLQSPPFGRTVTLRIAGIDATPGPSAVEFGIKLSGPAGLIVANTAVEGNCKINTELEKAGLSSLDQRAYSCIAQIATVGTGVVGAGFLVPGGHVIEIAFPWSSDRGRTYYGEVVAWFLLPAMRTGEGCVDIAVLKLAPQAPLDVRPAWLQTLDNLDHQRVRTAGFPVGYMLGRHAQGRLEGSDSAGWFQAISPPGDMTFLPGHSGAPAFLDSSGTVVAMVAMTDDTKRDVALLIPATILRQAWPSLGVPSADILARNPYRGLEVFRPEHRALFKGRDRYIEKSGRDRPRDHAARQRRSACSRRTSTSRRAQGADRRAYVATSGISDWPRLRAGASFYSVVFPSKCSFDASASAFVLRTRPSLCSGGP